MFEFLDQYQFLLPFIIFFGRIIDVTLGTLRIIFVSKGERYKAPIIGFFEVFIWIVVISQILSRANGMIAYLSYAAGYAAGNYVGILIEQRIAFGILVCRIYSADKADLFASLLRQRGYGATIFEGSGAQNRVYIVEAVIDRKEMPAIDRIITGTDPNTFYTTEDVRIRQKGIFPKSSTFFRRWRQGK